MKYSEREFPANIDRELMTIVKYCLNKANKNLKQIRIHAMLQRTKLCERSNKVSILGNKNIELI